MGFQNFGKVLTYFSAMLHASDAAILLGDEGGATALYDLLLPYRGRLSFAIGTVEGSTSLTHGSLATFLRRFEDAADYFVEARELLTRFDARYFLMLTDLEEATLVEAWARDGDAERARACAVRPQRVGRVRLRSTRPACPGAPRAARSLSATRYVPARRATTGANCS